MKLGLSDAATNSIPGDIDYRLARQNTLAQWRAGTLSTMQVCDAQSELRRNAAHCGTDTDELCPICEEVNVRHVTYVFGPRLPAGGRCVLTPEELARLARRKGNFTGYVVEVCPGCAWNHLQKSYILNPL